MIRCRSTRTVIRRPRSAARPCTRQIAVVLSMALGLAALAPRESTAIDIERMVMPGPLAADHADLEKDCSSCHQAFDGNAQRGLCLACHEEVAADLAGHRGFHGRSPLASVGQCRSCHPDHRGRDADILGGGEATFDHALTDFPLKGRHEAAACSACHTADTPRREAKLECFACHESDDAHDGALSQDCGQCHGETGWRTTDFDHAKTDYPLTGAHARASCGGCHVAERYEGTPQDCVACHGVDDAHEGRFGTKCADCHDTKGWQKQGFDHLRESGFALSGSHAKASCASCHREPPGQRKLPETCSGCHAQDDVHAGRFGADCGSCHPASKWAEARFDHSKTASFDLVGAHARADCNTCHTGIAKDEALPKDCAGCHARDDVHRGELGKDCGDCHDAESFAGRVRFDHEITKFPLLGLHASTACESCHADSAYRKVDVECNACHAAEDVHEGTLGTGCESCHNPNGWTRWKFDHDAQTDFALHGAHADLECAGCHRTAMAPGVSLSTSCVDCHLRDDAHRDGFGRACDACHSDEAWKPAHFGRPRSTKP
ncbi:MAG: cytochrome C [Myxococcota bacterium]